MFRLNWRRSLVFFTTDTDWKKKLLWGGFLILFPPLGWPVALGFRKETALRLVEGKSPILPECTDGYIKYLAEGLKATGVIMFYYVPFFILYWVFALESFSQLFIHGFEILSFILLIAICVPVFMPLLPVLYNKTYSWVHFSTTEVTVLIIIFACLTFIIPSAFMRVSLSNRFKDAFRIMTIIKFIRDNFMLYIEAWIISILVSIVALSLLIFSPWGIFWSYLVIIYLFNEVLFLSNNKEAKLKFTNSIYNKL